MGGGGEKVDYSHRICVTDVVVKTSGKQSALSAMLTLNETFHGQSCVNTLGNHSNVSRVFTYFYVSTICY